jgi:para-aminobenzoate synthetase component 1
LIGLGNRLFIPLTISEALVRHQQALQWAATQGYSAVLGHHGEAYPYGTFPALLAVGAKQVYAAQEGPFSPPAGFFWVGAISYDYGCQLLDAPGSAKTGFCFFEPEHLLQWLPDGVELTGPDPQAVWATICNQKLYPEISFKKRSIFEGLSYADYAKNIAIILENLRKGLCYEVNYCHKEALKVGLLNEWNLVYEQLVKNSPMPFQFGLKTSDIALVGSSPERFLKRTGQQLIGQPIKGTAPRGKTKEEDEAICQRLKTDEKTLAENMMITDLVRNDLVQVCKPGTVQVEELFGLYSFNQLHQLITTVSGEVDKSLDFTSILKSTFPMGSMTGAPKWKALELIAETEASPRGYFSGAVGYILPNGDFDFAVIIRSLLLKKDTTEYWAGGAIVWDSTAEEEWAESDLKMGSMRKTIEAFGFGDENGSLGQGAHL